MKTGYIIFNSGGACVADGVSLATVREYLTEARFARGWTVVTPTFGCLHSMEELDMAKGGPRPGSGPQAQPPRGSDPPPLTALHEYRVEHPDEYK